MCAFVWMKVLESAPSRYERGIRLLTLGAVDRAYDRLAAWVQAGQRVLDVGCGTGALTVRAAARGATVKGIDVNVQMLALARQRVEALGLSTRVELCEMGVAELDGEPEGQYDVVMSGLCFSELNPAERAYALRHAYRALKPGGLLLIADEVTPRSAWKWALYALLRLPLAALTWLLTQTTTRPVPHLVESVQAEGYAVESARRGALESLIELVARRPGRG